MFKPYSGILTKVDGDDVHNVNWFGCALDGVRGKIEIDGKEIDGLFVDTWGGGMMLSRLKVGRGYKVVRLGKGLCSYGNREFKVYDVVRVNIK